jgi:hypothetical protein
MSISKINGETIIAAFGGGYSLRGTLANAAFNPSGGFTYYGGGAVNTTNTTTVNTRRIYIPKSGTIKSCYGFFNQIVSASANTGILYIRLNNMDDYQVGSLQAHNVNPTIYYSTTLNIAGATVISIGGGGGGQPGGNGNANFVGAGCTGGVGGLCTSNISSYTTFFHGLQGTKGVNAGKGSPGFGGDGAKSATITGPITYNVSTGSTGGRGSTIVYTTNAGSGSTGGAAGPASANVFSGGGGGGSGSGQEKQNWSSGGGAGAGGFAIIYAKI